MLENTVNRRLDEWVTEEKFDLSRLEVNEEKKDKDVGGGGGGESSRKMTRNLKRRNDELNHNQKACITKCNITYGLATRSNNFFFLREKRILDSQHSKRSTKKSPK
jgi:hypothetical protein